jgi:G-rich domain on putative tyrosine kinase
MLGITDNPQIQNEMKLAVLHMEDALRKLLPFYTEKDPEVLELRRRIANYQAVLNALPAKEIEFFRLKRELEANQEAVTFLRRNVERARLFSESGTDNMQIIAVLDPAIADGEAVSPKTRVATVLAIIIGLVFGIIFAFVLDYLDPTIRTVRDTERSLGLRVVGSLPRY